jgi:hypothetical protein
MWLNDLINLSSQASMTRIPKMERNGETKNKDLKEKKKRNRM